MLALSSPPIDSEDYLYELKWDGTRCIAFVEEGRVRLQNRRLLDITRRYPEFRDLPASLRASSAILDGEIVVLEGGRPDFRKLQEREHVEDPFRVEILSRILPATYVVFDLLSIDGKDLMKMPLVERRRILEGLFPLGENVILSEVYPRGKALYKEALSLGFEGIMAKRKDSPYLPGVRSSYWLKVKGVMDVDAVVCGYLEGEGERRGLFGSLVLGLFHKGRLVHIGQVGTGFDARDMEVIQRRLKRLATGSCPFEVEPRLKRRVFWCRPEMVVRVSFQEWTVDGKLRAPSFKGIRDDKGPEECLTPPSFPGSSSGPP